jgi:hypothetical protein
MIARLYNTGQPNTHVDELVDRAQHRLVSLKQRLGPLNSPCLALLSLSALFLACHCQGNFKLEREQRATVHLASHWPDGVSTSTISPK